MAYVPTALKSPPRAVAAMNGGTPGAAIWTSPCPPMRARRAAGPPSNVKILASMPYLAKMPVSWATHGGMWTRLGGVVGIASPSTRSFGCARAAPPAPTSATAMRIPAMRCRPCVLDMCAPPPRVSKLLLLRHVQPGRHGALDPPQQARQADPQDHEHDDRDEQPVGPEVIGVLDNHIAEPGDRRVELGDDHPDEPPPDAQPDPGKNVRSRGRHHQVAPHRPLPRAKGPGDLEQLRVGVLDPLIGVDEDGEDAEEEDQDHLGLHLEPGPQHDQRDQ